MLRIAQETLPKESKQLLKTEAQKLKRHLAGYANQNVPVSGINEGADHKKYHKSFKTGKTYKFNGALSKRAYNEARQGWFVESGRPVAKGYRKKTVTKTRRKSVTQRGIMCITQSCRNLSAIMKTIFLNGLKK